ncbi:hypothetical protein GCM10014715_19400 [Streptomyces spiralis]|uniref:Uncharacterized protein n=1 Tax=Streptomyces spiralis TaxID=66376 RepID=A0A918ZQN6_9ACTN|nr:hypothetical protein GCM10014715_19400 [Streptomyces spiralis]
MDDPRRGRRAGGRVPEALDTVTSSDQKRLLKTVCDKPQLTASAVALASGACRALVYHPLYPTRPL